MKVKFKPEVLKMIREFNVSDLPSDDLFPITYAGMTTWYAKKFDVPYFKVNKKANSYYYRIVWPLNLEDFVLHSRHVILYHPCDFTIEDELFEL
jgi:hypothetical protein